MQEQEKQRSSALAPGTFTALLKELFRNSRPLPDAAQRFHPGDTVGRFELIREVARGGFGIVYEARDRGLGRTVAFKTVRTGGHLDVENERLLREAEAAALLSHPNIVTLHDVGRCEQGPYLVMELLRGCTLGERLSASALSVTEALRVGIEVAKALAHAHAHGVVHRDLTPRNIFLCDDGQVKVLDFGMALAFGHRKLDGGTVPYMAPEQVRRAPEDERTDVFALGVILYFMLSGKLPFESARALQDPRPAPVIRVAAEPELGAVLARMLDKDPVRRPRDGGEVLSALTILQERLAQSRPLNARVTIRKARRRNCRTGSGPTQRTPRNAIAVLPFADMSPQKDQEYFSDGIAEEILNELSHVPGLIVAGRTSCFSFKGKNEDLRSIGRKLNVAAVLEGSVRSAGNRVRITAQLVNVTDGYHLWSSAFDRELTDILAVQDEIASAVVEAMKVTLLSRKAARKRVAAHPDAYNEYLLGRHLFNLGTSDGYHRAVAAFEKAIVIDATYAPAWAWLSTALLNYDWSRMTTSALSMQRALAASEKAVELAPGLAECYSARGWMRMAVSWDWAGARADLERAIHENARDTATLVRIGNLNAILGRLPEAMAITRRASDIDPLYSLVWYFLSLYHNFSGRPDLARDAATRALEISPHHGYALRELGNASLLANDPAAALAVFQRHPSDPIRLAGIALAQHDLGNEEEEMHALGALHERFATSEPYQIALVRAWRGDVDAAFEWLERSLPQKNMRLRYLKLDPMLAKIRRDPRHSLLLRKLNLPVDGPAAAATTIPRSP